MKELDKINTIIKEIEQNLKETLSRIDGKGFKFKKFLKNLGYNNKKDFIKDTVIMLGLAGICTGVYLNNTKINRIDNTLNNKFIPRLDYLVVAHYLSRR
jgi:glutamine amidotransferase-like uncharacterized protein